jgi:hypothetical protein
MTQQRQIFLRTVAAVGILFFGATTVFAQISGNRRMPRTTQETLKVFDPRFLEAEASARSFLKDGTNAEKFNQVSPAFRKALIEVCQNRIRGLSDAQVIDQLAESHGQAFGRMADFEKIVEGRKKIPQYRKDGVIAPEIREAINVYNASRIAYCVRHNAAYTEQETAQQLLRWIEDYKVALKAVDNSTSTQGVEQGAGAGH